MHDALLKRSESGKTERIVPDNTIDTQECNQHTCGEADIQGSPDQPEQRQPQST